MFVYVYAKIIDFFLLKGHDTNAFVMLGQDITPVVVRRLKAYYHGFTRLIFSKY